MWSSKYADCEKSAKGSRAHLKQKGSQLQPTEAAFSEVNFQGREQPPLQWTNAAFSVGCPTHEARRGCEQRETKAAKGSSAYMEQTSPKLQQKNASFSAGMKPQGQPKEAAISVGNNKEQKKGVSQWGKGASNGIHETHEEFVCKFREKLQEFAMILNKKYHYNFPAEYFDDYRGSFNKEEFLGIKCSNEKSRRQEADESAMKEEGDVMKIADFQPCDSIFSNSNNYGGLDQGVWSKEGLKEHIGSFREEEMMETTNQKTEMARGNKESRGLVINLAAVIENLEEGIRPSNSPINRLEEEIGKPQCKDIIAAIPGGVSHIVEASSDIAEKEVHIRENFSKQEGKGVVVNHFGKEDQCGGYVAAPKEALARIEVAADPRSHVQGQTWTDYPRQVNKSSLLHSQVVAEIFAEEHGCRMNGNTKTAAMGMSLPCLLVWGSDKLPKKIRDTTISSSRLQISVVLFDQWRVIDFGCVLVEMDMRTTAVTVIFVSIKEYPSRKKKKPRRRKWEKEIKQKMKVGIG